VWRSTSRDIKNCVTCSAVKSVETEIFESLIAVAGDETQEQDQGVAIAANGVQTHAAERRQILAEELLHSQAKVVGARAFHDELPLIR
jgi:hypothetical protein